MKHYFMWAGASLLILVVVVLFASGTFQENLTCQLHRDKLLPSSPPEVTVDGSVPEWWINAHCSGVENDLYFSFYFVAFATALIIAGYVVR